MSAKPGTIMLATGGTGGHIFPAAATAKALAARGHRVLVVIDRRGLAHGEKFANAEVHVIAAGGIAGRGPLARGHAALRLGVGLLQASARIARSRPDAVLGFGGYAALPTVAAALLARVPAALHEQNAILGRANRLLAPRVRLIATSFAATEGIRDADRAKASVTGNPVRSEIAALASTPYPALRAGDRLRLLVLGGSQGARVFSRVVPPAIEHLPPARRRLLKIDHQARPEDQAGVEAAYRHAEVEAEVSPFFRDVPERLAACHLVIGRSGASSCAELAAIGRPAILVPYPHAIDDHQMANAQALDAAGGAWLIPERTFDEAKLRERLEALIAMPETLACAAKAARTVARLDAAERLAALAERLLPANGGHDAFKVAAE
ncbi:MAG TPA: undecaprenyldiphospho-muramoylpentapeptide beta-N-acetylglucosaminyltransferase [Alphaproteobacteria bacterium]|nr:undecaprenyldiphospho-muramoylpentapeptide beta-N-acetylglucosaminyltransferase [Alphaproteobacteria bacterium]